MSVTTTDARDLTSEETQQRAEHCFEIEQNLKAGLRAGREAMWEVARCCHEFDEQSGWTALGYDSMSAWLADPDVGMARGTFYRLARTYRELVVQRGLLPAQLKELDTSKVDIVLPRVRSGVVRLQDALDDSKELGQRDLRQKYMTRPDPADEALVENRVTSDSDREEAYDPGPNDGSDAPQLASDVEVVEGEVVDEDEPAHNEDPVPSGQVSVLAVLLAEVVKRVAEEVAPPEKKRMTNELRALVLLRLEEAVVAGLVS